MLNSLFQLLGRGAGSVVGGAKKPAPQGQPASSNPGVTDLSRVLGTLVTQGTADRAGYTPNFRNFVQNTLQPRVLPPSQLTSDYPGPRSNAPEGSFGQYIKLNSQSPNLGEVLTHEATHGVNHLLSNPGGVQGRYSALQQLLGARQRAMISTQAQGSNTYGGHNSPYSTADEGLAYGSALALQNNRGAVADLYAPYFRSQDPYSFSPAAVYAEPLARNKIDFALKRGPYARTPQFSDWRNE